MQRQTRLFLSLLALGLITSAQTLAAESLSVVAHVDLQRYLGDWYEIPTVSSVSAPVIPRRPTTPGTTVA
jgi:lipocalin